MIGTLTDRAETRGALRPQTLACTVDGIWVWPATPLTEKRGGAHVPYSTPQVYPLLATFHGPDVHAPTVARMLERAAAFLNVGRLAEARQIIAAIPLPPVTFDGAALMRAIGRRLGIAVPKVEVAGRLIFAPKDQIEWLATIYDREADAARALEKIFSPDLSRLTPDLSRVTPSTVPFDPALHPRWPSGRPDGGEFRPNGGDGAAIVPVQWQGPVARGLAPFIARLLRSLARKPAKPPASGERNPFPRPPEEGTPPTRPPGSSDDIPPGKDHNQPPEPIEPEPPPSLDLPPERPSRTIDIYRWGRTIADVLRTAVENGYHDTARKIGEVVDDVDWLRRQIPNIISSFDPPKDLDQLIEAAQQTGPHPGYEDHHIVEQGDQNSDLPRALIEGKENIVRIPYYKHRDISNFYQRSNNPEFGGLSPREGLEGKSFQEKYEYGLKTLRQFKALQ